MERVFARLSVPKHWWENYMMEIPHTFVFGLIMYSMVCKTTRYVQYSKVVASIDTKVIKELIVGQQWKMSLSTKVALMTCFLARRDYEVLVVSNYIDTVFINAPCDFRFELRVLCNTQYGGTVSWNSSKQVTVANSITEAKYVAAFEATNKMLNHIVHSWTQYGSKMALVNGTLLQIVAP